MFEPHNQESAVLLDRIAWELCQIIDDDAPLRWTRYRSVARCIASNKQLIHNLNILTQEMT